MAGDRPVPTFPDATTSGFVGPQAGRAEPSDHGGNTLTSPRFAKIDFATYDDMEDPLNWLNQCEQFFCGQRTLVSDRTWLASYHLRGAA